MAKTYNDYPIAATNNAKKALRWKEEYGDEVKGGTIVGWTRANQLASREPLSYATIARMATFNRHRSNSEVDPKHASEPWKDRGYVAWLIWGGTAGVDWAIRKAKSIREEMSEHYPENNNDREMIEGIAEILIQISNIEERRMIAMQQIDNFKRDGVMFDEAEFLKMIGL